MGILKAMLPKSRHPRRGGTATPARLAGLALANGVLVIGPRAWAVAVRGRDGRVAVARRDRELHSRRAGRVPLLRGVLGLAEMLAILPQVKRDLPQARFAIEQPATIAAMLGSSLLSRQVRRKMAPGLGRDVVLAAASAAVMMALLRPGRIAAYHGAEHKVIAGYELGIPAVAADRAHPRCGTMLLAPMLLATTAVAAAARALGRGDEEAQLLGSVLGVGIATEVVRRGVRGGDRRGDRLIRRVGLALQRTLTTREPDAAELDVAARALREALR